MTYHVKQGVCTLCGIHLYFNHTWAYRGEEGGLFLLNNGREEAAFISFNPPPLGVEPCPYMTSTTMLVA